MHCSKCGAQVSDTARFCPKCGARIERLANNPSDSGIGGSEKDGPSQLKSLANIDVKGLQLVECIISVVLGLMVLFAPVIKINYYFGNSSLSMIDLLINASRFRDYLGEYAVFGIFIGVMAVIVSFCSFLNAKQALENEFPTIRKIKGVNYSFSNNSDVVTVFAIILIILLFIASNESYGIAGASGWAWLLLLGGIACEVVHSLRKAANQ